MEPVSLAFGVLPVVGGAVKTCKAIRKKLKIFRHYSRELGRVQKRVRRQSQAFTNEIDILLMDCLHEEDVVELMLKDERHPMWTSEELERAMRRSLGTSYRSCREIIEEIGSTMAELQSVFDCFDQILDQCDENEHPRDAIRRLRDGTRIVHDEPKLEQNIKDLDQSIKELIRFREQTQKLSKPVGATVSRRVLGTQTDSEYNYLRKTKEASNALHEAFATAWSEKGGHGLSHDTQHVVRLFLHTDAEEDINMNAAILCNDRRTVNSSFTRDGEVRVSIRSQSRDLELGLSTPPGAEVSSGTHSFQRKMKVRFCEAESSASVDQEQPCSSSDKSEVRKLPPNLSAVDLCSTLYRNNILPLDDGYYFGYLDGSSHGKFRHHFYKGLTHDYREAMNATTDEAYETLIPMSEALDQSAERSITIVDQLKTAREIAYAVLKLNATPWIKEYFNIYDLMLYNTGRGLTASLKTLHVASDFTQIILTQEQNNAAALNSPTPIADDALQDAKLLYGIRNLTLWSLGAVLLQVGQWSALESLEDVIAVRKLSRQASNLGPRYRGLTKKCLDCDFGYGDDLTEPCLQQAVYEGLVGELSEMISTLDVEED